MSVNPFRPFEGPPIYQEEYRGNYAPKVIEKEITGLQVVAPDTPYVAATGTHSLYFIDTRFDPKTAQHIKEQIENATMADLDERIDIDEILITASRRNPTTGKTAFVFDPVYVRVLFAKGINRCNPEIKLPEYPFAGDWVVNYDLGDGVKVPNGVVIRNGVVIPKSS